MFVCTGEEPDEPLAEAAVFQSGRAIRYRADDERAKVVAFSLANRAIFARLGYVTIDADYTLHGTYSRESISLEASVADLRTFFRRNDRAERRSHREHA